MSISSLPALVMHADWSVQAEKRWATVAIMSGTHYIVEPPCSVEPTSGLINRLIRRVSGKRLLLGFDFPIGLPRHYADVANITRFRDALALFGQSPWEHFYCVAETATAISLHRPFYPYRPGGTCQRHLVEALQLETKIDL